MPSESAYGPPDTAHSYRQQQSPGPLSPFPSSDRNHIHHHDSCWEERTSIAYTSWGYEYTLDAEDKSPPSHNHSWGTRPTKTEFKGTKKYGDLQVFCVFFTINLFAYTNGFVAYTRLSPVNQLFAF